MRVATQREAAFLEGAEWHTRLAKIDLNWARLNRSMKRPKPANSCLVRARHHALMAMSYALPEVKQ